MRTATTYAKWLVKWAASTEGAHYGFSHLKLQKILYYAQTHHLGRFDRPLFKDEIQAWAHGPVVKNVYRDLRNSGSGPIDVNWIGNFQWGTVDPDTTQFLIEMWDLYGGYSGWKLRDFSHQPGTPWHQYFVQNVREITIPQSVMQAYAKTVLGEPTN